MFQFAVRSDCRLRPAPCVVLRGLVNDFCGFVITLFANTVAAVTRSGAYARFKLKNAVIYTPYINYWAGEEGRAGVEEDDHSVLYWPNDVLWKIKYGQLRLNLEVYLKRAFFFFFLRKSFEQIYSREYSLTLKSRKVFANVLEIMQILLINFYLIRLQSLLAH